MVEIYADLCKKDPHHPLSPEPLLKGYRLLTPLKGC